MNPIFFNVNTNLNLGSIKESKINSNLKYLFFVRKPIPNSDSICFSVILKNSGNFIINRIWFSTFVGIGGTKFAHGLDDQDKFYIKSFLGQYLSGYTKDFFKFTPETILDILYFEIPKDNLYKSGSIEFFFGSESIKKVNFSASWEDNEINNKMKEINTENFIKFIKYKNQKTIFKQIGSFSKKFYKSLQRSLNNLLFYLKLKN